VRQLAQGAQQRSLATSKEQLNHLLAALHHLYKEENTLYAILQKQDENNANKELK
jgi:iron-sulfur cluster repair protein YtfE (RIC family)